ncbi:hypothetical protein F2Q69_00010880 [Brassica cretica]|uniref:Uncharacterized protein n=1 Tax=Brassica cretica TaxID=69181 RepID=A0A8S9R1T0_BRACR|nr:hypothetical protein F2Q69_00010880 [Brassica cretica]
MRFGHSCSSFIVRLNLHCATKSVATVAEFEHHLPSQAAVTAKGRRVVDHNVEEEAVHVDFMAEEIRTTTTWQSSLLDITSAHGRGPKNIPGKDLRKEVQTNNVLQNERCSDQEYSHDLRKKSLRRGERYTQRTSGIDWMVTPTQSFPEIGRDIIRINTVLRWNPEEKTETQPLLWNGEGKDHHDMSHDKSKNYTLRSENLRGKHWERPDKRLSTRRSPTDSQRTISDHFPSKWPRSYPGGRRSHSPPSQGKMEWRPVTRPRET